MQAQQEGGLARLHAEAPVLYVLGRFELRAGSRLIIDRGWGRNQASTLLKRLALEPGHAASREEIARVISPGLTGGSAANSLYKSLHYIRAACGEAHIDDVLELTSQSVALNPGLVVDVDAFRLSAVEALRAPSASAFEDAISRYGGEVLPDDVHRPWTAPSRRELRGAYHTLLFEAAKLHVAEGKTALAIARLETLVLADPANEAAQLALMQQYLDAGWRDRALRQFEVCRDALTQTAGIEPNAELRRLYESVRRTGAGAPGRAGRDVRAAYHGVPPMLVGREDEMAHLRSTIDRAAYGQGQVCLVGGEAGAGKTRLAEEAAAAADQNGALVLWGRCYEGEGAPVYWPWLQVIRRYINHA